MKTEAENEAGSLILRNYGNLFKKQYQEFVQLWGGCPNWNENKSFLPIKVDIEPNEFIPLHDLLSSDNTLMTKVLSVFSSLCIEVMKLKAEAFEQHFIFLSVYDEYRKDDISLQMKQICLLNMFMMRCEDTLRNLCSQVFAIFSEEVINLNGIQLHFIINHIGELFTILEVLELLISNTSITTVWNKFCRNFQNISNCPENVELSEEKMKIVKMALDNITTKIMSGNIVQNSLQNMLTLRNNSVAKNGTLSTEFSHYIKQAIFNLDKLVHEKPNIHIMYKCIKINCLFVLYSHLFGSNDKKTFRSLIELNTKVHSVYVVGTTIWFPEQFLQRHVQSLYESHTKSSHIILKTRQFFLSNKKNTLSRDVLSLQNICSQWVLYVEKVFSTNHHELNAAEMSLHAKILIDGLDIASNLNYSVLILINLHSSLGIPLTKNVLRSLFDMLELLKTLQNALTRNWNEIINSINMVSQHLSFQITTSLLEVKKSLMNDKNYINKRLDELTCLVIAERALKGAYTLERNIASNIALSFIPNTTYLEDSYVKLCLLLEKLQTISNFMKSMEYFTNCSWILWHQNVIPIYFEQNFPTDHNSLRLRYFLMVLEDCIVLLHKTDKYYEQKKSCEFLDNIKNLMSESVLSTMSQSIETNLRLQIHSHLQLDTVNPFSFNMLKKLLLMIDNFRIQCIYISVIPAVEHYLSTMYYNLTTVVLSDWKTYGEMRQMGNFKFNLKTVEDNLPTQTLEQGLDVLEIMRNIHLFVSKYLYNLNNQIFIEKSSNNKHLNSINIIHVANSIRTHGTGIMNTTVNFTYQFLKKKFFTFSQFMYDEYIKSRLIKDMKSFKDNADQNCNMYPYKNADKFNKSIKALGLDKDGKSYLDLFRDLISQIGNAMGYVRMIRSGGRHCCSDATIFLPSVENNKSFKDLASDNNLETKTLKSAENLDNNIKGLINNFIQGTEYFKLLVDVFSPVFRNEKNIHLKNFYIIVPTLTLNFVEHMILSKDKMSKKNKVGAAFTDDGFAVGIAYVLKLLDQDYDFESLHWFDSVWKHLKDEKRLLEEQKLKGTIQLQQALALTEIKIKTLEDEYKLLYYSLTSARIFFRS